MEIIEITRAADVNNDMIATACDLADGFWPEGPIDWEDFIDKLERYLDIDFGSHMESPAIAKIQRAVRKWRQAG